MDDVIEINEKDLLEALKLCLGVLSSEQRLKIFKEFCVHCGDNNPNCKC